MVVGERIRALREEKKITRGDLQQRTGYTVPAIETLEKFARGLKVPIYRFFYEGIGRPPLVPVNESGGLWGADGKEKKMLGKFRRYLAQLNESERSLLLYLGEEMARRKKAKANK